MAAPTAGLHFSPAILEKIKKRGVEIAAITLEVGLGTFQPIHVEEIDQHQMHAERYEISEQAAAAICNAQREARGPSSRSGTTVVRALEDAAAKASCRTRSFPASVSDVRSSPRMLTVIPSAARNLSAIQTQEKRDSSPARRVRNDSVFGLPQDDESMAAPRSLSSSPARERPNFSSSPVTSSAWSISS